MASSSAPFEIVEVAPSDRRRRNLFLDLPFRLYRDTPQWVPPLRLEIRRVFDPARHPFYRGGEAVFLLALGRDGLPLGRLALLNNQRYNEYNHQRTGFFFLFECEEDVRVSRALFDCAFDWARARGLERIEGPRGFTALDGIGMLVRGFEHRPAFGLPYNLPYYPALVEASGFETAGELLSGYLDPARVQFPEKVRRAAELVQKRRGLRVVRFKNRRDFARLIPAFQDLYNASLGGTSGNVPLSGEDIRAMADQLLWFADPRLVKIIMKDDELAGFLLAYPDISAAIQRCRGRLFPFGWLDMLLEMKRTRWVNVNGAAIIEKYRGLAGTALLFNEMYESICAGGFEHADLVQIGVENERMQLELRSLGIDFYKTHRLYRLDL